MTGKLKSLPVFLFMMEGFSGVFIGPATFLMPISLVFCPAV